MVRVAPAGAHESVTSVAVSSTRAISSVSRFQSIAFSSGSYSTHKLQQLDAFCQATSSLRVLWILVRTPLPSLLAALLLSLMPLQPPSRGPDLAVFFHCLIMCIASMAGTMVAFVKVTAIPPSAISFTEIAAICVLAATGNTLAIAAAWCSWRFPTPFALVLGAGPYFVCLFASSVAVLRSRLWTNPVFRESIQAYGPCLSLQMSQILVYPCISMLFDNASAHARIAITLAFPLLKFALKRKLKTLTRGLQDSAVEVAVCGVEISASMYQSMVMQAAQSATTMAIILVLDMAQSFVVVRLFMDRYASVAPLANDSRLGLQDVLPQARQFIVRTPACSNDKAAQRQGKLAVENTLRVLHVSEEILLSEYFEVVVPVVNTGFLLVAGQLPYAQYNSKLERFHGQPLGVVLSAAGSLMLYSSLQFLSFVAMHFVMKRRYNLSGVMHLAFILDRHDWSIMGKMMAWVPYVLHFTVIHYGGDFTFKFGYAAYRR